MTMATDFELYAHQKRFNESVTAGWQAAFDELVTRLGRSPETLCFLDVGCGDGKYFRHLQTLGLKPENIHGVEVSKTRVERCRALGWHNTHLVDGITLPFSSASMDLIHFMEVIEHVPHSLIRALLKEIRRVLAPHGYFLVSTPNYPIKRFYDLCDAVLHRKWARLHDDPTHVSFYNHRSLSELLNSYFTQVEERMIKDGFLYRRLPYPQLQHKIFCVCSGTKTV